MIIMWLNVVVLLGLCVYLFRSRLNTRLELYYMQKYRARYIFLADKCRSIGYPTHCKHCGKMGSHYLDCPYMKVNWALCKAELM